VTADFAYLVIKLRRHGIRVEVASVAANLGNTLRTAANDVIDLAPLFRTFEIALQDSATRPRAQQQGGARRVFAGLRLRIELPKAEKYCFSLNPLPQRIERSRNKKWCFLFLRR
jgi:Uncharacterized conserved protein